MKTVTGMLIGAALVGQVWAAADLEVNTPAISQIKGSMQSRHGALAPLYASGAVGLTKDGLVALRDANAVPLPQRAQANQLVSEENRDRGQLYKEIARANNHPEWEAEIRSTFAQRWIDKAQGGWFVQKPGGEWVKK
nr:YdbL family protein [Chitinivorax tropicus]